MGAQYRHAAPRQCRAEQGRSAPCAKERLADRSSGRNPGSDHGKPALPHVRPEPAHRSCRVLEYSATGQSRHSAQAGGPENAGKPAQAHLTARMRAHFAHRTVHLAQNDRRNRLTGYFALFTNRPQLSAEVRKDGSVGLKRGKVLSVIGFSVRCAGIVVNCVGIFRSGFFGE